MKSCGSKYKMGGKVRNVGGVKAPPYGENSKIINQAKEPTNKVQVLGSQASMRLDRPAKTKTK